MAIHHFGTSVDGSVFLEQTPSTPPPTAAPTNAPQRPGRGLQLLVRNPADGSDLPNITTGDYGYWEYTTQDIPIIWVSADNFVSKLSIRSTEAMDAAATSGTDVLAVKEQSQAAFDTANQALSLAQQNTDNISSVNGQTGTVVLTAANVGARPTGVNIPVAEVAGLAPVATSGAYADLTGKPAAAVALTSVNAANGVAPLDASKKVPLANLPDGLGGGTTGGSVQFVTKVTGGTWAARPTADAAVMVIWKGPDPSPAIVTSGTGGMLDGIDVRFVTP